MRYETLNKTNTLLTNAMQFMSSVLWVMTKTMQSYRHMRS